MEIKGFPYKDFDKFVDKFLKGHHSSFSEKEIKSTPETLLKKYAEKYWVLSNADKKQVKFEEELLKELEPTLNESDKEILNHAIWLWGYPNNRKPTPINIEGVTPYKNDDLFKRTGVASAGAGYVQYKTRGVLYCLYLIYSCWKTDNLKTKIEEKIKDDINKDTYEIEGNKYTIPKLVCNLLLHIVNNNKYEPIATDRDKELIRSNFWFLLDQDNTNDVNDDIRKIRNILETNGLLSNDETFYNNKKHLELIWRSFSNNDLPLTDMLRIKKAVILYGPPGTGKTYTAREIAKQLYIQREFGIRIA